MVSKTREPAAQTLKFKDKLVGKAQSSDALLKKMKALHTELAEMDQDLVDTKSLSSVKKDLMTPTIMLHKDKGVKAHAACCMADLLRLYAPDAPYTGAELKDMFQFFFRQLSTGLKGTDSPYFNQYIYLLESLSTIKSVVLVCDLPNADELTNEVFRIFFDLVRQDMTKKVEMYMSDILVALVEESASLPSDVLEILLAQFVPKNARMDHPAFRLAVDVCNATADRLQRHVAQYFSDIILQHDSDEELDGVQTAHDLIVQINRSCPTLLNNVIPQLETELHVDEAQLRVMSTQTLGEMFSSEKGGESLMRKYPQTWKAWLRKSLDKSVNVRIAFVQAAKGLLAHHKSMSGEVGEALRSKTTDPEEKVRAATCKVYAQLDYETALHHVSVDQLKDVAGRILDKKQSVRHEALTALGLLYRPAYPEIEANDQDAIDQFGWIPGHLINAVALPNPEIRSAGELVLAESILPLPPKGEDEATWTERLLVIMRSLDKTVIAKLLSLSCIQAPRPMLPETFVQCCIQYNGGIIDENEEEVSRRFNAIVHQLSTRFPDPVKAAEDFTAFAMLNESRLYKLLSICMDPQVDLKTLVKSTNEFNRRVLQSSSGIVDTMADLVRRSSLHTANSSSVPTLVKRIQRRDADPIAAGHAQTILSSMAKHCPAIFATHVGEFSKALSDETNPVLVEICLQAISSVATWDKDKAPSDKRTIDKALRFVTGENPRHAKFAARFLAHVKNKSDICEGVIESIADVLDRAKGDSLESHLAALAELASSAPDAFETKSDVIIAFLLKDIIMQPGEDGDGMDVDEEWVENEEIPYAARIKILAVKVCVNRCLAHSESDSALHVLKPVNKLLFSILANMGAPKPGMEENIQVKARLRLQAACSLLKLSTIPTFFPAINPNFRELALMMQDQSYGVRLGFVNKLLPRLQAHKLDARFNVIPFLTIHDPLPEIREKARQYIRSAFARSPPQLKVAQFEMIFLRLMHLLAHHPDFSTGSEELLSLSKYIGFYLDLILTQENVHLIYHLAQKGKAVRDESHTYSQNLYVISELAQHMIRGQATRHGWTINACPVKVKPPADIFKPLPSPEAAATIHKTVYLPEDALEWLGDVGKMIKSPTKKPKAINGTRKRKSLSPSKSRPKRLRIKRRKNKSSEDEESSATENEDDSDEEGGDHRASPTSPEGSADEDDAGETEEPKLGRGARGQAQAKRQRQARKAKKSIK